MKRYAHSGYTFAPSAHHVDLSGMTPAITAIGQILAILDLTTDTTVYKVGSSAFNGSLASGVLTFTASNAGMASGDDLLVVYDDGQDDQPVAVSLKQAGADLSSSNPIFAQLTNSSLTISGTLAATQSGAWNITNITGAISLPTGAATAANQAAGNTTLGSILTTLQGQRAETLWTDDTGAFFVRVDSVGTITWTTLSGTASSAPGSGARPAEGTSVLLSRSPFQATAAGTGYSIGDYLDHFVTTDPGSGAVIANFWINTSTNAKLASAPPAGNVTPVAGTPTGGALDATLTGGTQRAIARGGAKGTTPAADVTSTASGANHQAVDVVIYDTAGNPITSFGGTVTGTYNTTPPTLTNGQTAPLQTDANGQLKVAGSFSATVQGKTTSVAVTLTVTASSAYASGNVVGGLMTFPNVVQATPLSGIIQAISLRFKSVQTGSFDLYLFGSNPTASTFTDKTAPSLNAADFDKVIAVYSFTANKSGLGTHTIYDLDAVGRAIVLASTSLYGVLITTSTPTFASASDPSVLIATLDD